MAVVDEAVDRQQLDRGHAEPAQIGDHLGRARPAIGAAQLLRHGGMQLGEAAHMGLVEDRAAPTAPRRLRSRPQVKAGSMTRQLGMNGALSRVVEGQVVAGLELVAEQRRVPFSSPTICPGVGVEQQLVRIEAVAFLRLVGAVHAIAVDRAGPRVRQVAVPDLVGVFGQFDAVRVSRSPASSNRQSSTLVALRREQGEIDPQPVPVGAQRKGRALPDA